MSHQLADKGSVRRVSTAFPIDDSRRRMCLSRASASRPNLPCRPATFAEGLRDRVRERAHQPEGQCRLCDNVSTRTTNDDPRPRSDRPFEDPSERGLEDRSEDLQPTPLEQARGLRPCGPGGCLLRPPEQPRDTHQRTVGFRTRLNLRTQLEMISPSPWWHLSFPKRLTQSVLSPKSPPDFEV